MERKKKLCFWQLETFPHQSKGRKLKRIKACGKDSSLSLSLSLYLSLKSHVSKAAAYFYC